MGKVTVASKMVPMFFTSFTTSTAEEPVFFSSVSVATALLTVASASSQPLSAAAVVGLPREVAVVVAVVADSAEAALATASRASLTFVRKYRSRYRAGRGGVEKKTNYGRCQSWDYIFSTLGSHAVPPPPPKQPTKVAADTFQKKKISTFADLTIMRCQKTAAVTVWV